MSSSVIPIIDLSSYLKGEEGSLEKLGEEVCTLSKYRFFINSIIKQLC